MTNKTKKKIEVPIRVKSNVCGEYLVKVYKMPKGYDSDDIRFEDPEKKERGYGFKSKKGRTISLVRCPDCGRENYALAVTSGQCSWCPFSTNNVI